MKKIESRHSLNIYLWYWKLLILRYIQDMQTQQRKLLINILFLLHLIIIIIWFGLFFVPYQIRPWRISFHFWYISIILIVQLLWSLIVFQKIDMICPLTTWMQELRGYKMKDKRNYGHSFIAELLELLKIKINFQTINIILLLSFVLVVLKYLSHMI
jgi:hypothetical protein